MALLSGLEVDGLEASIGAFRLGPVRLTADAGGATVVLGPSGAGKTTLLRAIAGLLPLRAGKVRLDGTPLERLPPEQRGLGFVPPDLGLFPHRRVRRNVSYPLDLRGATDAAPRTEAWLERFGLAPLADRFPEQLSSGERQRVAMARALAAEPRLLLWDEPLSSLDVESRDSLLRLVRELLEAEQLPLVLVTHDPGIAFAVASKIVVLEGGRVRSDGPPEALASGPLDRFTARFLGYENLFTREEIETVGDPALANRLRRSAGPEGIVVPSEAVGWGPVPTGPTAEVAAVRWTAAGWTVALRSGSVVFRGRPSREPPGVRVGDRVALTVETASCKPLLAPTERRGS